MPKPTPLSEKHLKILDLRENQSRTHEEIQAIMELKSQDESRSLLWNAKKRREQIALLEREDPFGSEKHKSAKSKMLEHVDPEKSAAAIELLSVRMQKIDDVAKEAGLPTSAINSLKKRLESQYLPVKAEIGRVKTDVFLNLLDGRAKQILESIDEMDIMQASLKDKVIASGILLEKRQLLSGEPTQIISSAERESLSDLIPALVHEAERRGLTIDVDPQTGETRAIESFPEDIPHVPKHKKFQ